MRIREIKKGVRVIIVDKCNPFNYGQRGVITNQSNGYVYVKLDGYGSSKIFKPKELKLIQNSGNKPKIDTQYKGKMKNYGAKKCFPLKDGRTVVLKNGLVYNFSMKPLISKKTIDIIDEINRKAGEAFAEKYNKEIRNINQPVTKYEIKITKKNNISALLWVLYVELLVLGFFIGYLYF